MKKRLSMAALAILFTANLLILAPRSLGLHSDDFYGQLALLVDVRHELVSSYVEEPDQQELVRAAIRGMIGALNDPYTAYLSPDDLKRFDRETTGSFSGIGAEVTIDPKLRRLKILSPIDDAPAWKAGVMAGDIVLKINDEDTLDMPIGDAVDRLIGEAGTDVTILVRHESGEEESITITRAQINVSTIRGLRRDAEQQWQFMIDREHKIAYVRVKQFNADTARDLAAVLDTLAGQGMRGLILDLRFNPGGLLPSAIAVSDIFLDKGQTIVSVKGRIVPEQVYAAQSDQLIPGVELVVLASGASASAAEIVTGALSDNGRAQFIGTRTFGKGSVQQLKALDRDQGALKITNAFYYIPSGTKIHRLPDAEKWGVDPQDGFFVVMSPEQIEKMHEIRREGDILRRGNNGNGPEQPTPEWIEQNMADTQLAAGMTALLGKFETGEWPTVGQAGADLLAKRSMHDNLVRRRERLQEALTDINLELEKLERGEEVTGEPVVVIDEPDDLEASTQAPTEEEPETETPE